MKIQDIIKAKAKLNNIKTKVKKQRYIYKSETDNKELENGEDIKECIFVINN